MFFDAGYHSNIKDSKHQDSSFSQGLRKPEEKLQSHKNKVALSLLLRVVSCLIYANANVFSSEIFKNGRLLQLRIRRRGLFLINIYGAVVLWLPVWVQFCN